MGSCCLGRGGQDVLALLGDMLLAFVNRVIELPGDLAIYVPNAVLSGIGRKTC